MPGAKGKVWWETEQWRAENILMDLDEPGWSVSLAKSVILADGIEAHVTSPDGRRSGRGCTLQYYAENPRMLFLMLASCVQELSEIAAVSVDGDGIALVIGDESARAGSETMNEMRDNRPAEFTELRLRQIADSWAEFKEEMREHLETNIFADYEPVVELKPESYRDALKRIREEPE